LNHVGKLDFTNTNWNTNQFVWWSNAQCQPNWWSQFNKINGFNFTLIMHMFKNQMRTYKNRNAHNEEWITHYKLTKQGRIKWEITTTWMLSPNILEMIKNKNWQSSCINESTTTRTYNKKEKNSIVSHNKLQALTSYRLQPLESKLQGSSTVLPLLEVQQFLLSLDSFKICSDNEHMPLNSMHLDNEYFSWSINSDFSMPAED